jgi:hypothetical protein
MYSLFIYICKHRLPSVCLKFRTLRGGERTFFLSLSRKTATCLCILRSGEHSEKELFWASLASTHTHTGARQLLLATQGRLRRGRLPLNKNTHLMWHACMPGVGTWNINRRAHAGAQLPAGLCVYAHKHTPNLHGCVCFIAANGKWGIFYSSKSSRSPARADSFDLSRAARERAVVVA